ncbi:uncharacterized secreted protein ARB_00595; Flags: Precursor [Aspergillus terreus]|uniref:Uncharacterized secreted protein ARB_00595; Flags n=1 Tax=Aspergillus terreus TaxID=33178 RepID=A0A5M3YS88_ASPTE|nr:hypothetical protein ATETN484_0002011700 [Aspergillus terreus]GFF14900.1 uncharacterized secreted protein ARB_00595; Flags: Precursor [Aspergillus terreus]
MLLKLHSLLFFLPLLTPLHAAETATPATKDSTIYRSTVSCPACPDRNCYKCTLGHNDTLVANTGGLAYLRWLVGFDLPAGVRPAAVTACTVQFPAFVAPTSAAFNVTVSSAVSADWDEDTVSGENAPDAGAVLSTVQVAAGANLPALDVTGACRGASGDGAFSIYVGTVFGRMEVWSKDSGNPAILHVSYDDGVCSA